MIGSIPVALRVLPFSVLYLANNSLCYSVNYGIWSPTSDYSGSLDCAGCTNPCLNTGVCHATDVAIQCVCPLDFTGPICQIDLNTCRSSPCQHNGVCVNGIDGFSCQCAGTGYSGNLCEVYDPTNYACQPGSALNSTGICSVCGIGTFSTDGLSCVSCQSGTYSNLTGSTSAENCTLCPPGTFSTVESSSCSHCDGPCAVGSMVASPFSPLPADFLLITYDSSGQDISKIPTSNDEGYIFLGIFGGCILLTAVVGHVFRRWLTKLIAHAAVILKTPFGLLKVTTAPGILTEAPSFHRGLVGVWVITGLIVITAYQIYVFIIGNTTTISSVQPGSAFSSGEPTSVTNTTLALSLVLFQTSITCDPAQYRLAITGSDVISHGALTAEPQCVVDSSLPSVNLSYTFPALLGFTSSSVVAFTATSTSGSPLFSHGVNYELSVDSYDGNTVKMTETLSNDASDQLTGDVTISLSAVPTEQLTGSEDELQSIGYTFSHFSSEAQALAVVSSPTLTVSFSIPVPQYYYQVKDIVTISGLQFVVGLVSLASGVITAGSIIANSVSYARRQWKRQSKASSSANVTDFPLV